MDTLLIALLLSTVICLTWLRLLKRSQRLICLSSATSPSPWLILIADSPLQRSVGLLNHVSLEPRQGLLITNSRRVHTCGMLFSIDLVGLNQKGEVTAIYAGLSPGMPKITFPRGTKAILELTEGQARFIVDECASEFYRLTEKRSSSIRRLRQS